MGYTSSSINDNNKKLKKCSKFFSMILEKEVGIKRKFMKIDDEINDFPITNGSEILYIVYEEFVHKSLKF